MFLLNEKLSRAELQDSAEDRTFPASPAFILSVAECECSKCVFGKRLVTQGPRRVPSHHNPAFLNASRTTDDTKHHRQKNKSRTLPKNHRLNGEAERSDENTSRKNRWDAVPIYDDGASVGHRRWRRRRGWGGELEQMKV